MWRGFALLLVLLTLGANAIATSEEVSAPVADAFDYPVGKPNAAGYHKARGFQPNGHLGEDWDGDGGGGTDLGDPVYAIGNGVVLLAREVGLGWGQVILVRHAFFESNRLVYIDSLYGHVKDIVVREGQIVSRGQKIGTIGTGGGLYPAHLHFEIHKNLGIGVNHASCARDFTNYYDPSNFLDAHRSVPGGPSAALIAMRVPTPPQPGAGTFLLAANQAASASARALPQARRPFRVNDYRYSDIIEKDKEDLN